MMDTDWFLRCSCVRGAWRFWWASESKDIKASVSFLPVDQPQEDCEGQRQTKSSKKRTVALYESLSDRTFFCWFALPNLVAPLGNVAHVACLEKECEPKQHSPSDLHRRKTNLSTVTTVAIGRDVRRSPSERNYNCRVLDVVHH